MRISQFYIRFSWKLWLRWSGYDWKRYNSNANTSEHLKWTNLRGIALALLCPFELIHLHYTSYLDWPTTIWIRVGIYDYGRLSAAKQSEYTRRWTSSNPFIWWGSLLSPTSEPTKHINVSLSSYYLSKCRTDSRGRRITDWMNYVTTSWHHCSESHPTAWFSWTIKGSL